MNATIVQRHMMCVPFSFREVIWVAVACAPAFRGPIACGCRTLKVETG